MQSAKIILTATFCTKSSGFANIPGVHCIIVVYLLRMEPNEESSNITDMQTAQSNKKFVACKQLLFDIVNILCLMNTCGDKK